jgi:hypothetical protein
MYSQSTINFCSVSSALSFLSCQLIIDFLDVLPVSYQIFFRCPPRRLFLPFLSVDWLPGCTPSQLSISVRCPPRWLFLPFLSADWLPGCTPGQLFSLLFGAQWLVSLISLLVDWFPGCTPSQLSIYVWCPPRGQFSSLADPPPPSWTYSRSALRSLFGCAVAAFFASSFPLVDWIPGYIPGYASSQLFMSRFIFFIFIFFFPCHTVASDHALLCIHSSLAQHASRLLVQQQM